MRLFGLSIENIVEKVFYGANKCENKETIITNYFTEPPTAKEENPNKWSMN